VGRPRNAKVFRVGTGKNDDFTPAEVDLMAYKIAEWYKSPECDRNYDDPLTVAKQKIKECLLAITADGKPWKGCPHEFNSRIRAKTLFNLETGEGTSVKRAKHPDSVRAGVDKEAEKAAREMVERNPAATSFDMDAFRASAEREILTEYPELDNPVHRSHVRRLSLLYAQQEMLDRELSMGLAKKAREDALSALKTVEDMAEKTMKLLDIHPDQLHRKMDRQKEGTLGELISMLEADDEFIKREKIWALQAAYQLWLMTQKLNGRGDGPQLEPWELFHMTRVKEVDFTCRHGEKYKIIAGWEPDELKEYLLRNGMELDKRIMPSLPSDEVLEDLAKVMKEYQAKLEKEQDVTED